MTHHHHSHHPHADGYDDGPSHELDHEIYDIAPDHDGHHHHNKTGNVLYCPDGYCLVGLVTRGYANFFDSGLDAYLIHKFGPADHTHE